MDKRIEKFWQSAQDAGNAYPDLEPLLWWAKSGVDGARLTLALHTLVRAPTRRELEIFDLESDTDWYLLIETWLTESARDGYLNGYYGLGKMKYYGIGGAQNYELALAHFNEIDSDGWHSAVLDYYIGSCLFFLAIEDDTLSQAKHRIERAIEGGYVFARIRQAEIAWRERKYLRSICTRFRFSAESFRVLIGKPSEQWKNTPPMVVTRLYTRDELADVRAK